MVVTNKYVAKGKSLMARFEDSEATVPETELFADEATYVTWEQNQIDEILGKYNEARGTERNVGLPLIIQAFETYQIAREGLNGSFTRFKESLLTKAVQILGKARAGDLMDTLKNLELKSPTVDKTDYDATLIELTAQGQASGFKPGQTGKLYVDPRTGKAVTKEEANQIFARFKADNKDAEARLSAFFTE